jgi:hypothetical protein
MPDSTLSVGTPVLHEVVFPSVTGMPRDEVQNEWVSDWGAPTTTAIWAQVHTRLQTFYGALASYLSPSMDWAHGTIKSYALTGHLDGTPHGSPIFEQALAIAGTGGFAMPNGCAVCLSYFSVQTGLLESGALVSTIPTGDEAVDEGAPALHSGRTRPKARTRGRIYLGPFCSAGEEAGGTTHPDAQPLAAMITAIKTSAAAFLAGMAADGNHWLQWSRANAATELVVGGFVQDTFTYQRRREFKAQSRVLFP